MSGPYPPSGYPPPPDQGGWPRTPGRGGQYGGPPQQPHYDQQPHPQQFDQPFYEFPTVQYGGLAEKAGGWGEPPRKKRNVGRMIVAVVSVLVIIGGVATAVILLNNRHSDQQAATAPSANNPAPKVGDSSDATTPQTTTGAADPGLPNGSTTLTLTKGACVSAKAGANNQYDLTGKATCGTAKSDLVLAEVSPAMTGCADHQYLRVSAPTSGVYCFTLDLKAGDCLDNSYLKIACGTTAPFTVLKTEAGPGGSNSCTTAAGATHWVPIGHDPVTVGCIGPPKGS